MYTALLGIRGTWALLAKFIFSKIRANSSGNGLCSSLCQTTVAFSDGKTKYRKGPQRTTKDRKGPTKDRKGPQKTHKWPQRSITG